MGRKSRQKVRTEMGLAPIDLKSCQESENRTPRIPSEKFHKILTVKKNFAAVWPGGLRVAFNHIISIYAYREKIYKIDGLRGSRPNTKKTYKTYTKSRIREGPRKIPKIHSPRGPYLLSRMLSKSRRKAGACTGDLVQLQLAV